jgi:hypothetical protein
LVWTDDDLVHFPDDVAELAACPSVLLISPDPETGLTRSDLDRIAAFLAA